MQSIFDRFRRDDDDQTYVGVPKQLPGPSVGFETVVGHGCNIEGTLRSEGNIRIDGHFTGTFEIDGNVLVGETAVINADVNAKNVSIAGTIHGNVTGGRVQILRTGRVHGDISAGSLTTEEGAYIDGKISMTEAPIESEPVEPAEDVIDAPAPVVEASGDVTEAEVIEEEPVATTEPTAIDQEVGEPNEPQIDTGEAAVGEELREEKD
jgi:cytoskeletal protein CcmA (bactofilin family)